MRQGRLDIRFNTAFATVIRHCAHTVRPGQQGTWVTDDMMAAYNELHRCGHAHSVETWLDGRLAGGLYAVSIGRMVYGESMFSLVSNASKIALAGLVAHCIAQDMPVIDCQQETSHLASLGAHPVSRQTFETLLTDLTSKRCASWEFNPASLEHMLGHNP
jgi:leucyl/phenylalanyl-tRNA--protein transferase